MTAFSPPMERLNFVDGQTLTSRDLRDGERNNDRLRAFHNRYLHDTWGISFGLQVAMAANHLAAIVQPGYAIDGFGNGVILLQEVTVRAPRLAQAEALALAVSSPGTFEWWSARDLTLGVQVPLGAAFIKDGVVSGLIDLSVRRYARSFAVPRLANGATEAGQTGWTDSSGPATWIEATIDTRDAGFVGLPQYFAAVEPAGACVRIVSTAPQSFVARIIGATAKEAEAWTVSWVGVESGGSE